MDEQPIMDEEPKQKVDTPEIAAFRARLAASRAAQRAMRVAGQIKYARIRPPQDVAVTQAPAGE